MKKIVWNNFLFLFCVLVSSCSTIRYQSSGLAKVEIGVREKSTLTLKKFSHQGTKEFYLWGQIPQYQEVKIDLIAYENGLTEISKLEIEEYLSFASFCKTIFSFGFLAPRDYIIRGYGR